MPCPSQKAVRGLVATSSLKKANGNINGSGISNGNTNGTTGKPEVLENDPLEKLRNDLNYMQYAFKNLREYEKDVSRPILTLRRNLESIIGTDGSEQQKINRISKDIGNLNSQIPPTRKFSSTRAGAHQDLLMGHGFGAHKVPNLHFNDAFLTSIHYEELQRSFKTLKDDRQLCLLCLAVFPENTVVKRRLLTYWWAGERLLDPSANVDKTLEEMANDVLEELEAKGFIEPVNKKRELKTNSFKMQPVARSAVIELAKKHKFFNYDSDGNPTADSSICNRACWLKVEGESSGKALVNSSNMDQEASKNIWKDGCIKHPEELETLFNVSEPFPDIPLEEFSKMRKLNVLCLGRWQKSDTQKSAEHHIEVESTEFLKGLNNMSSLRFLSLQGISRIDKFPSSGNKFTKWTTTTKLASNLMILDLKNSHNLEVLPDWLKSLTNLTHLDISECFLLNSMPKELSSLSKLQVLKGFVISDDKKESPCNLADLAKLKKLRKLSININKVDFAIEEGLAALKDLQGLKSLSIAWGGDNISKIREGAPNPGTKDERKKKGSGDTKKKTANSELSDKTQVHIKDTNKHKARSSEIIGDKEQQNIDAEQNAGNPKIAEKKMEQTGSVAKPIAMNAEKKTEQTGSAAKPIATNADTIDIKSQDASGDVRKKVRFSETREDKKQADDKEKEKIVPAEQNPKVRDKKLEQGKNAAISKAAKQGIHPAQLVRSISFLPRSPQNAPEYDIVLPPNLEKLDLRCFPDKAKPSWLAPENLKKLNKLCIRGGSLTNLGEVQENKVHNWKINILYLKYLEEMKINWTTLQALFPDLEYFEKVKCPKISLCPCDGIGVWLKSEQ
ncbi:uncharacterized protein LOC120016192 isoform X2 [Tripterygium wilfordii]|uniref:uncharacterized protein LOC120016192 isoform X2 n=1 Tax=Tripterygium wilfordii TaxID=458696 RepID=UPI0018F85EF8|nr:uncharacterized protein LOC120016192 isoform X2 [Tripterygium wilfordii]